MPRALPVLAAVPLVLAYGLAEGLWTDRWGLSQELEQAPAKLALLPRTVGPWQGQDEELDPRQVARGELRGHVLHRYVHRDTGEALTLLAVCGRPGPIAVHAPEVCFGGSGFTLNGPKAQHTLRSGDGTFWAGNYSKADSAVPEHLRLYWSWNASGQWEAVENPRLHFARARVLYKLYVTRQLARPDEPEQDDPIPGFLEQLLPPLGRCLFGPGGGP
jgi:hypothetical protein